MYLHSQLPYSRANIHAFLLLPVEPLRFLQMREEMRDLV